MGWPPRGLLKSMKVHEAFGPPLAPEELTGNLTQLEQKLNAEMRCPAGRNQVYIRSLLTGTSTTRPRIALKCPLRRAIGLAPDVFYYHICDVCCTDPEDCQAWRAHKERFVAT